MKLGKFLLPIIILSTAFLFVLATFQPNFVKGVS